MGSQTIVLFDLPTKEPRKSWSPNSWKTRFVLNFKRLDYTTEWIEYPDIKPRLENHVQPHKEGRLKYTVPTIMLPDETYIMESKKIAQYLEEKHPSPPLHLNAPELAKLESLLPALHTRDSLVRVYFPLVPQRILSGYSQEYWRRTREEWIGQSIPDFERTSTLEQAFEASAPILKQVTELLQSKPEGPFFLGKTVSYVDFVWGAYFLWMREMGDEVFDLFVRATGDAEANLDFFRALSEWWGRNDH